MKSKVNITYFFLTTFPVIPKFLTSLDAVLILQARAISIITELQNLTYPVANPFGTLNYFCPIVTTQLHLVITHIECEWSKMLMAKMKWPLKN